MSESISKLTSGQTNFSALFIVPIGVAIILTLAFIFPVSAGSVSWQNAGSADLSLGAMQFESLSVYNCITYAAFMDSANGDKATVMDYTSGSWHFLCFTLTQGVSAHVK